jgi:drug/metabolite transporter (DMT)-like permease
MFWIFFSLLSAFFQATTDAFSKKLLRDNCDVYLVGWARWAFAVPFLLTIFLFIRIPTLDQIFWLNVFLLIPLEITALILYIKALKLSPLSVTIPFLSFSPVFLIFTSFLMLGEKPDTSGFLGILLVSLGSYLLNFHTISRGIIEPIRCITKEKGCLLMMGVALIYSITSNLGKAAIQHSSPAFFAVFYLTFLSLIVTPIVWFKNRGTFLKGLTHLKYFLLIGLSCTLMFICHTLAINVIQVPYMISLKRTSTLISIVFGRLYFNEIHIKERLLGSTTMFLGVILITLF